MKIALREHAEALLHIASRRRLEPFDTRSFDYGIFQTKNGTVAWDNRNKDLLVEDFVTPQGAINWVFGEMIFGTKRHCTEGFCINDGDWYCDAKHEDKLEMLIELLGFEDKQEAYEVGFYYFTEWEEAAEINLDDYEYVDGREVEIWEHKETGERIEVETEIVRYYKGKEL